MYLMLKVKGYRLQAELTKEEPAPAKPEAPAPARRRLPIGFTRNPSPEAES